MTFQSALLVLFISLQLSPTFAAPAQPNPGSRSVQQFIEWESQHNVAFPPFDSKLEPITHIEIQIDHPNWYVVDNYMQWLKGPEGAAGPNALILDIADYLPPALRDLMIFERDGKRWLRYFISPDDRSYFKDVEQYLTNRKIPFKKDVLLYGYKTSSRTIQAVDPETGRSFQIRPSSSGTSQGQGGIENRPLPARWAWASRRLSDYFKLMEPALKNLTIAYEAAAVGFPPLSSTGLAEGDQAQTYRLTEEMSRGKIQNMTGFVFDDREEAEKVAKRAGMTYDQFWTKAMDIKGRAIAEMVLILGFRITSNHTQNFRWELDQEGKLTGRMVLLDLTDGAPIRPIFEKNGAKELVDLWKELLEAPGINLVESKELVFPNFFSRGWKGVKRLPDIDPKFNNAILKGIKKRISELTGKPVFWLPKFHRTERANNGIDNYSWELRFASEKDVLKFVKKIPANKKLCDAMRVSEKL